MRGYEERELSGDSGATLSVELLNPTIGAAIGGQRAGVVPAPLPDGVTVGDWIAFADAQTGKLDEAKTVMAGPPASQAAKQSDAWWNERNQLARDLLVGQPPRHAAQHLGMALQAVEGDVGIAVRAAAIVRAAQAHLGQVRVRSKPAPAHLRLASTRTVPVAQPAPRH